MDPHADLDTDPSPTVLPPASPHPSTITSTGNLQYNAAELAALASARPYYEDRSRSRSTAVMSIMGGTPSVTEGESSRSAADTPDTGAQLDRAPGIR